MTKPTTKTDLHEPHLSTHAAQEDEPLVRLRIDLAYDGADFRGFAHQRGQPTVQGVVEDALARLCGRAIRTVGAGRTDAGVHATGQAMHADVPRPCRMLDDLGRARDALDAMCGRTITIWRVRRVPASFDARFSAAQRRYRYRICDGDAMAPLWRHDTWHVKGPRLDTAAMHTGGQVLVGEHDFSSFCRRRDGQHLIRRIDDLTVRRVRAGLVVIDVAGKAFCHQMVRSVAGCLYAVGRGRRPPEWVANVLAAGDRQAVGQVAPPHGLTLVGVTYPR